MAEMLTLNDWRMVNMMLDDRNMYDQHVVDEAYRKLHDMAADTTDRLFYAVGKEYEVGFEVRRVYDRLIDSMVAVPMLYVAKPSDCIEQSLGAEQPTAIPLSKPWCYEDMDELYDDAASLIARVDELDAIRNDAE
jgi:hypothetical protein